MRKSEPVSFRLSKDEHYRYAKMAIAQGMSMTEFIIEALRDKYDKQSQLDRFFADGSPDEVWYGHA